jgi:subtilisin family serine protease
VLASSILAFGGNVTFRYENVAALAATLPSDRLQELLEIVGERAVWKDRLAPVPDAVDESALRSGRGLSSASLDAFEGASLNADQVAQVASFALDDYKYGNSLTGAPVLHGEGVQGAGVIVAVIDSGTANASTVTPLSGSVIGGESLVTDPKAPSATSTLNNPHGTQVASMIAAHGSVKFSNGSSFVQSLKIHAPASVVPAPCPKPLDPDCTKSLVPMIGTAPGAKIYAVKVVGSLEPGAPESRLTAAMDRVLTLRRNFDAGMPSVPVRGDGSENNPFVFDSLKIQVVNMSIGGPTLFAGQGLADELTVKLLRAGIVVVASAGNNGPAAMTGGSPGTGRGALTVGAASSYVHERVLRDTQFGVGSGVLYRPVAAHQMWSGSSRGPTADGRWSPHVVANGFASFVQDALLARDANGALVAKSSLQTGTSFAAPAVAGAAALLVESSPTASAAEIRNALIRSADPTKLGDGSERIDQGAGWIDVPAARALLNGGDVPSRLARGLASERVTANIRALGIHPVRFIDDRFTTEIQSLKPGQVAHFFVPTPRDLAKVTIKIRNITAEAPQPNLLFCDNLMVHVVDAPTSLAQPRVDNTFVGPLWNGEFCNNADATFDVKHPQHGLMRIAIAGSFSNVGNVSAELEIERHREIRVRPTETGRVRQGDLIPIEVNVPAGTKELTFDLSWESDWSRYPTADLDLLLVDPQLRVNSKDGATLSSPERITIKNPTAGVWTAQVSAITIHRESDNDDDDDDREWHGHDHETCMEEFALRVLADGQPLPKLKSPRPPRRRRH